MQSDEVVALTATIAAAFGNGPVRSRRALVYEGTWETRTLIRHLAAVHDRPDDRFIEQHFSSLPAFTAQGLRHVLPQYLIYSLKHPESDATERVIFHLAPDDTSDEYWRERVTVFTTAQKHAICDYLRFMQLALAGEHYDEYLDRALTVWGCASPSR
jgi:hypothetical protein